MAFTVQDLINEPGLGLKLRVTGQMDREIRWVQVSDLIATGPRYVRGGDVILNDERWLTETEPEKFVQTLVATDASALGCGLRLGSGHVGIALVRACETAGLTLFTVPATTPFVAVVERFVSVMHRDAEDALRTIIDRSSRLVCALEGPGADLSSQVLAILRSEIGADVWLINPKGQFVCAPGNLNPPPREMTGIAPAEVPAAARALGLVAATVSDANPLTWLLYKECEDPKDVVTQVLPFLASALSLDLAELMAERRYAVETIELVLDEQERLATARLEALRFETSQPFIGIALSSRSGSDDLQAILRATEQLGLLAVAAPQSGIITVIAQDQLQRPTSDLALNLHRGLGGDWVVGVGNTAIGIRGLRRSLIQAREVRVLAAARGPGLTWAAANSLSTHRLLLDLKDSVILEAFADSLVQPLLCQDKLRGTQLMHTLGTFLSLNGHYNQTAAELHIHVNTLRQRLSKCENLTNRTLSSMADRVDLFLALAVTAKYADGPRRKSP